MKMKISRKGVKKNPKLKKAVSDIARVQLKNRKTIPTTMEQALAYHPWIYATQYVIDHSVRRSANWCMFSRALAYSLPGATRVEVSENLTTFTLAGFRYAYATPVGAAKKVIEFDDDKNIAPWKVRLGKPLGVRPVENRPPRTNKPYKKHGERKGSVCKRQTSRRWHGLKLPFTVAEMKAFAEAHS